MMPPATFESYRLLALVLLSVAVYCYAGPSTARPACLLGKRADVPGEQPLEHAVQLVDLNHTAPCYGTLTSWHYCHYPITGTVSFQVWRKRGAHQLDLVHSQEFPIASGKNQGEYLACETYRLANAEVFGVLPHDIVGVYVKYPYAAEVRALAVHVSKSHDTTSQLYQLTAVSEPNSIEMSTLSILNQAVLHLSADIRPDMALPPHALQRDAARVQGLDPGHGGHQNLGSFRYPYAPALAAVLAPLVAIAMASAGLLCCKLQPRQRKNCTGIDEMPTSKKECRSDWTQREVAPHIVSSKPSHIDISKPSHIDIGKPSHINIGKPSHIDISKPSHIDIGKPSHIDIGKGTIHGSSGADPLVYEVPVAMEERRLSSPEVYELPVSAGETAQSPLLCDKTPAAASTVHDPLTYEVPLTADSELTGPNSSKDILLQAAPSGKMSHTLGASDHTPPLLHPTSVCAGLGSAVNRSSCVQEEPASSEMELICQLAREEVTLICSSDIRFISEIGRGLFGSIRKALWHVPHKKPQEVTVIGLGTQNNRVTFLQAAVTMSYLKHPNVVAIVGVVNEPESVCVLTEHFTNGSLLNYLYALRQRDGIRTVSGTQQLETFAQHAAQGMIYLSDKGIVHFGLAAKNVFVSASGICKIGGIENTRLGRYDGIFDESLINWMSVEVLRSRHYSMSSDVWSFGCLLYELWTLGEMPFKGCSPSEVIRMLSAGHRLPPPPGCSRKIYKLMITAWHPSPSSRPSFRDILAQLEAKEEQPSPLSPEFPDLQRVGGEDGDGGKIYDVLHRDLQFMYHQQPDDDDYSECEDSAPPLVEDRGGASVGNLPKGVAGGGSAENELISSLAYDRRERQASPPSDSIMSPVAIVVTEETDHTNVSPRLPCQPSRNVLPQLPQAPPPRHHSAPGLSSAGSHCTDVTRGVGGGGEGGEQLDVDYDEICSDTGSNLDDSVLEESIYDHLVVDKCEGTLEAHGECSTSDPTYNKPSSQSCAPGPQSCAPGPQSCAPGPQSCAPGPQSCAPGPQSCAPGPQSCAPGPQNSISHSNNSISNSWNNTTDSLTNSSDTHVPIHDTSAPVAGLQPLASNPLHSGHDDYEETNSAQTTPVLFIEDPASIPTSHWQYNTMPAHFPYAHVSVPVPTSNVEPEDDYDEVASDGSSPEPTPLPGVQSCPLLCRSSPILPPAAASPNASDFEEDYDEMVSCGLASQSLGLGGSLQPMASPSQRVGGSLQPMASPSQRVGGSLQPMASPSQRVGDSLQPMTSQRVGDSLQHSQSHPELSDLKDGSHALITPLLCIEENDKVLRSVTTPTQLCTVATPTQLHTVTTPTQLCTVTTPTQLHTVTTPTQLRTVTTPTQLHTVTTPTQLHTVTTPTQLHTVTTPTQLRTVTTPTQLCTVTTPTQLHTVTTPTQLRTLTTPTQLRTVTTPTQLRTVTTPTQLHTVTTPTKPSRSPVSLSPSSQHRLATPTDLASTSPIQNSRSNIHLHVSVTQLSTNRSSSGSDSDNDYDHLT